MKKNLTQKKFIKVSLIQLKFNIIMKVLKPFGPKIAVTKIPLKIINLIIKLSMMSQN